MVEGKMKNRTIIKILPGEYWWGGACFDGIKMPFGSESDFVRDLNPNSTMNQAAPLLLSDKGRYIWSDSGLLGLGAHISVDENAVHVFGKLLLRQKGTFGGEPRQSGRFG